MNYLTIFEGILGIVCYLTALFLYALVNRKGSIIKKLFAATVPLVMISLISIITLNFVSSVNSMSNSYGIRICSFYGIDFCTGIILYFSKVDAEIIGNDF